MSKFKIRKVLLITILTGSLAYLLFTVYLSFDLYKKPTTPIVHGSVEKQVSKSAVLGTTIDKQENRSLPVRLKIPSIEVDAAIESVGLTTAGDMQVPSTSVTVGWYKFGPRPGEEGSAVIDGHLFAGNAGGVFYNLQKLRVGDNIYIVDDKGTSISFAVRTSRTYKESEYVPVIFNNNVGTHLNLITCNGSYNSFQKSFSKRLVIFADALN